MPSPPPTKDAPEFYLDGDMMPADFVYILNRLKFDNGKTVLQMDREARDYLVHAVSERHGGK